MSQHQPGLFVLGDAGQERHPTRRPPHAPAPSQGNVSAALHSRPPRARPTLLPRRLSPVYQGGALQSGGAAAAPTNDSLLTDSPASTLSSAALFSPATLEARDMTTLSFASTTMPAQHAGQAPRSHTVTTGGRYAMPLSLPPRPSPAPHAASSVSRLPAAAPQHTALVKPSTVPTPSLLDEPKAGTVRGMESAGGAQVAKRVRRSFSSASTRGSSAGSSVLTAPVLRRKFVSSGCGHHGELVEDDEEEDEAVRNTCATSCLSSQGLSRCTDSRGTTMDIATPPTLAAGGCHHASDATMMTAAREQRALHCDSLTIDDDDDDAATAQRRHTSVTLSAEAHVQEGDGAEADVLCDGEGEEVVVVSAALLRRLIGCHDDLSRVSFAELHVDTERWIGVDRLSSLLPGLNALRLNRSHIPQLRLLGSRYQALRYLWLNNCRLGDLRGIGACAPQLRELYVAFNKLTDLSPLMDLAETLQVLDAEANELAEVPPLRFVLASLRRVTSLTLQGNPVVFDEALWADGDAAQETTDHLVLHADEAPETLCARGYVASYQAWVRGLMPQLCSLDDVPLRPQHDEAEGRHDDAHATSSATQSALQSTRQASARRSRTAGKPRPTTAAAASAYVDPLDVALVDELRLVQDCLRDCGYDALDAALDEQNRLLCARPSTSCGGLRPSRGGGHASGGITRPATSAAAAAAAAVRVSSGRHEEGKSTRGQTVAEASALTTGGVFAGSAIASLRRRLAQPVAWAAEADGAQRPSAAAGSQGVRATTAEVDTSRVMSEAADPARASCESAAVRPDDASSTGSNVEDDDENTSEEDEWERYKTALMRERLGSASSAFTRSLLQECQDMNTLEECNDEAASARLPSRAHYMQLALREMAAEREGAEGATRPGTAAAAAAAAATALNSVTSTAVQQQDATDEGHCEGACSSSSSHCRLSMTTATGMSLRDLLVMTPLQRRQGTSRRCGGAASRQRVGSASYAERDVLDELVRKEVSRSRAQIARASVDDHDALENNPFLAHRDRFEVIALNSIPEHCL